MNHDEKTKNIIKDLLIRSLEMVVVEKGKDIVSDNNIDKVFFLFEFLSGHCKECHKVETCSMYKKHSNSKELTLLAEVFKDYIMEENDDELQE